MLQLDGITINQAQLNQNQGCMETKINFWSDPERAEKCYVFSKLFRSLVAVAFLFVKSYPINNQNFEAASQENFLEGCLFK